MFLALTQRLESLNGQNPTNHEPDRIGNAIGAATFDVMKTRSYIAGTISLLLAVLAVVTTFSLLREQGVLSFPHLSLAILGLTGSLMVLFGRVTGKYVLILFYLIQTFELFAGDFSISINVGIGFPIRSFYGGIEEAIRDPQGWGINLLAVGMLILTFMISKKETHNQTRDQIAGTRGASD